MTLETGMFEGILLEYVESGWVGRKLLRMRQLNGLSNIQATAHIPSRVGLEASTKENQN